MSTSVQAPGILNDLAANTIGVLWSAASGTVDPWTKDQVIYDSSIGSLAPGAADRIQAATGITPDQLIGGSSETVTAVLTQAGADPSQFSDGLKNSLSKFTALSGGTLLIIGIVALAVLLVPQMVKR